MHERHGCYGTPEYSAWQEMKKRCLNKNNAAYYRYGGRGITICDEWINSFPKFLRDVGLKPSIDYSIDRINNNGNYEPSNCRWPTATEQARNKRTYKNNKTGVKGVTVQNGKWLARITVNGNRINLGSFCSLKEATISRKLAELTFWK